MSHESQMIKMINDLQSKQAFQDDALCSLSDVISGLQEEIVDLRQLVVILNQRLAEYGEILQGRTFESVDSPPHY